MSYRAPLLAVLVAFCAQLGALRPAHAGGDDGLERGHYLVHQVSLCIDCHGADLTGGHVGHNPVAPLAPPIAGLPGLDVARVAIFLQTGILNGKTVPPPMPAYRMHADDARAVAAYLKSLPEASPTPAPPASP